MSDYAKQVLVDTQWVEDHLSDDSVRIVEVDENPGLYAEAHIPGAIGFDWKRDLRDQVKRVFLGPDAFGELFGNRGISSEHTIVLYGDRNNWLAAYTYWYLKCCRHERALLMNGPREKWISEGRPTTTEVPSHEPRTLSLQPGGGDIRAKRREILAVLERDGLLADGRPPREQLISMLRYERPGALRGGQVAGGPSVEAAHTRAGLAQLVAAHAWFMAHEHAGANGDKNPTPKGGSR